MRKYGHMNNARWIKSRNLITPNTKNLVLDPREENIYVPYKWSVVTKQGRDNYRALCSIRRVYIERTGWVDK